MRIHILDSTSKGPALCGKKMVDAVTTKYLNHYTNPDRDSQNWCIVCKELFNANYANRKERRLK